MTIASDGRAPPPTATPHVDSGLRYDTDSHSTDETMARIMGLTTNALMRLANVLLGGGWRKKVGLAG